MLTQKLITQHYLSVIITLEMAHSCKQASSKMPLWPGMPTQGISSFSGWWHKGGVSGPFRQEIPRTQVCRLWAMRREECGRVGHWLQPVYLFSQFHFSLVTRQTAECLGKSISAGTLREWGWGRDVGAKNTIPQRMAPYCAKMTRRTSEAARFHEHLSLLSVSPRQASHGN